MSEIKEYRFKCEECEGKPCTLIVEDVPQSRGDEDDISCPYEFAIAKFIKQLSEAERDKKNKQLAGLRHDRRIALVRVDVLEERIEALKEELGDE